MKKIFAVLLLLSFAYPENLAAQNGTTIIPMPGFFNPVSLRTKNCVAVDNNGNRWIGTRDIGLLKWDGISWNYFDANYGLTDNNVKCLLTGSNGILWAGTDTGGVCFFNGTTWGNFSSWNSPLPSHQVLSVAENGNDIWFGTNKGIAKYDGSAWTVFTTQNSGLPSDTVNQIAFSATGEMLAATSRGLIRFNGTSWSGLWYNTTTNVSMVYVNGDGSEWAVCNGELWKRTGAAYTKAADIYGPGAYYTGIKCLGKGPSGGIAFTAKLGQLNEISGTRIKTYYPYALMSNAAGAIAIFGSSPNGNYFSLVNSYVNIGSPYLDLFELNLAAYNGLGKGNTPDNVKSLDVNNVNARILNRGDMHWDSSNAKYETPKGLGICSIFCSAVWIGGLDTGGNLHEAAMTYRQNGIDFFPGPVDAQTGLADSTSAYHFDRLWKADQYQISEFQYQFAQGNVQNGNFIPANDIVDWPAIGNMGINHPLAPFVDVNNNGIYDPLTGGDYPRISGDQEIYWVFNDVLAAHGETRCIPVGVEIQARAYAYACPSAPDSSQVINYTTFYTFDVINRSNSDYHNFSFGFYQDIDLGNYQDDFIGCDPADNFGFCYNGDADDSTAFNTFASNYMHDPPTQATVVLDGPPAIPNDSIDNDNDGVLDEPGEKSLLTGFIFYSNFASNPAMHSPSEPTDYYGYLNGKWKDSTNLTWGGNGYGGITPARFLYPDLPDDTLGWNEFTAANSPGDRSHLITIGSCNFLQNDTLHYTLALVTTFDSTDAWNSHAYYQNTVSNVRRVQQWYANASAPSCFPLFDNITTPPENFSSLLLYPNPANDKLNVEYSAKNKNAVIEIYDASGKRIYAGIWNDIHVMCIPIENYATGIYFVRMVDGDQIVSQKFIKQ